MATQGRNVWKIFGIIVIIALIVLVAFLIGRGCQKKKDEGTTTSTITRPAAQPASSIPATPQSDGGAVSSEEPTNTVIEGPPTVVSTHDEVGPCLGGFQDVTHTTVYSDGTSASSISRQSCGIAPVPEPGP